MELKTAILVNILALSKILFKRSNGSLIIKKASPKDSGKYGCIAGNSNGLKRVEVDLLVRNLIDLIQLNISNLEKEKKLK